MDSLNSCGASGTATARRYSSLLSSSFPSHTRPWKILLLIFPVGGHAPSQSGCYHLCGRASSLDGKYCSNFVHRIFVRYGDYYRKDVKPFCALRKRRVKILGQNSTWKSMQVNLHEKCFKFVSTVQFLTEYITNETIMKLRESITLLDV